MGILLVSFCPACTREREETGKSPARIARVELPPAHSPARNQLEETPPASAGESATPEQSLQDQFAHRAEERPSLPKSPSARIGTVRANILNIRRTPDPEAEKVGVLPHGESALILGEEGAWYHIKAYAGYVEGWVIKKYIVVSSPPGVPRTMR
jgi:hypothetical protein